MFILLIPSLLFLYSFSFLADAPDSPNITVEIEATSVRVRWTAPTDDGGSPITGYRVVILQSGNVIKNKTTGAAVMEYSFTGLTRSTNYTVKVYALNKVFQGNFSELTIKTKYEGQYISL